LGLFTGAALCRAAISAPNTFWKVLRGAGRNDATRKLSVADVLPKRLNQQRAGSSTAAMTALDGLRPEIPRQTHRPTVLDAARAVRKFGRYLPCSLAGLQRLNVRNGSRLCKNRGPVFGRIFEADVAIGSKSGRSQTLPLPMSRSARYFAERPPLNKYRWDPDPTEYTTAHMFRIDELAYTPV
jgi:hypothetical protein